METKDKVEFLIDLLNLSPEKGLNTPAKDISNADWDDIYRIATSHGVSALIYDRLRINHLKVYVPEIVMQRMRSHYLTNLARNTRLYNALSKIVNAFKDENIPFIAMKGSILTKLVYGDVGLRPMSDIDLVIKPDDVWEVDRVMRSLGYEGCMYDFVSKSHVKLANNIVYTKGTCMVEMHPVVYNLPNIEPWENTVEVFIDSEKVLTFNPEVFIIHLCLHLSKHLSQKALRLIWWIDILKALKYYENTIDWNYFTKVVKKSKREQTIFGILSAMRDEQGVRIPIGVISNKPDNSNGKISSRDILIVSQEPVSLNPIRPGNIQIRRLFVFALLRVSSISDKLKLLLRILFPRKSFVASHYRIKKSWELYIFYLVHFFNVVLTMIEMVSYMPEFFRRRQKFLDRLEEGID